MTRTCSPAKHLYNSAFCRRSAILIASFLRRAAARLSCHAFRHLYCSANSIRRTKSLANSNFSRSSRADETRILKASRQWKSALFRMRSSIFMANRLRWPASKNEHQESQNV